MIEYIFFSSIMGKHHGDNTWCGATWQFKLSTIFEGASGYTISLSSGGLPAAI